MVSKPTSKEELGRLHHEALLAIVNDFLSWGGEPQAKKAKLAFIEVARRVRQRERAVRHDEKILAVIS